MGLFSSKYVHSVGTSIQRVNDPADIKDPLLLAINEATYTNVDLVDNILETSLKSSPIKLKSLYSYVERTYPGKLPSGKVILDTRFYDVALPIITGIYGVDSNIQYIKFGPMNGFHEAWHLLRYNHGFDKKTGIVSSFSTSTDDFYIEYILLELPAAMQQTMSNWEIDDWLKTAPKSDLGYFLSNVKITPTYSSKGVAFISEMPRVRVVGVLKTKASVAEKQNKQPTVEDATFYVPLSKVGDGKEYYQAVVSRTVGGINQTEHWEYVFGTGMYPTLDAVLETEIPSAAIGVFYPNIYFRLNSAATTDPAYPKMAKKLGIDYADMSAAINENPDITDVVLSTFNLALDADTTDPLESSYIFDFFDQAYVKQNTSSVSRLGALGAWFQDFKAKDFSEPKQAIILDDDRMKYALTFEKIIRTSNAGQIYGIGLGASGTGTEERSYETVDFEGSPAIGTRTVKYRYYRKQVSRSIWREIKVYDLSMVYTVEGDLSNTVGDELKEICLIPLDKSLVDKLNLSQSNELITRSMYFVFNSHVVQKLKWYQQKWFSTIIKIVGIVYFFMTLDAYGFEIAWAVATAGTYAAIQYVVVTILQAVLIPLALKVFVKIAGEELAFIAAIVAMAYGMFKTNIAFITPDQLLKMASGVFDAIGGELKDRFQDLQKEMDSFLSLKTEQEKQLEDAEDLLKVKSNGITPILLGELPGQFLYRNLVFGTSDFTGINSVDTYTDRALQLPRTGI